MSTNKTVTGGCHCGSVRYQVSGPLRDVVNCHCSECQRLNGNFGSHSKARTEHIDLLEDLAELNQQHAERVQDPEIDTRIEQYEMAFGAIKEE